MSAASASTDQREFLRPHEAEWEFVLTERDFARVRQLIYDYAGINLSPQKRSMAYNRLSRRLRALGLHEFSAYLALVQTEGSHEREAFVNALTTNLTAFFREPHHFDLLAEHARAHLHKTSQPMRVWSSACSTGEEAWSAAMVLREVGCRADILATDIDSEVLRTASAGVYRTERVEQLETARLRQHFLRGSGANEGMVRLRPELLSMVRFSQLNLQLPNWPLQGRFDAVFCRNVVIYFDKETQKRLLNRLADIVTPGGLLMVGHSESFPAGHPAFKPCGRTAYERRTA